ncbi:NAD(P)/FAD-dependent oxidoreductase [Kutzneria buriramensis]|uniref:FAD-dependent oxidoreductase n=1 Tax=Kutzneria buriramensis TaxID=1045776 RepID=UPI0014768E48|nr:FAD-dependent monooxygenase [Kutzneria buriramensis]
MAVLGGGIAGLLTANVLARYATEVTVVERDQCPDAPEPRAGVPQSRHTHVLLASGIQALHQLLPGFVAELTDAGAPTLSVPADVGVWQSGQWVSRRNPSAPVMTPSRPLLDHLVRKRVLAEPRVRMVPSTEATGLLGGPHQITGVTIRGRAAGRRGEQELAADLVVDATGRGSRTPQWLARLGAAEPADELLDAGRAYATGVFHVDDRTSAGDIGGFYIVPDAGQPLGAIILPAEDDRWMVTLSGPRGQAPPTDPAGFVDYARNLPHDAPHKWLSTARPLGRPVGYRHTANRRRRYDRARAGLLVVGDAVCALNPVYGQGMSVAAQNAVFLDRVLAGAARTPSAHELQQAILRSSQWAWEVATGADSPMPGAVGNALRNGPLDRLADWYLGRVRDRVPGDPVVCKAFRDVLFLLAPPRSLLTSPEVVLRSLLRAPTPTPPDLPTP